MTIWTPISSYCSCNWPAWVASTDQQLLLLRCQLTALHRWVCCLLRLNYINDYDPENHKFKRPIYAIDASVTKTGTLECYKPKGTWDNPDKRNWIKYEVRQHAPRGMRGAQQRCRAWHRCTATL